VRSSVLNGVFIRVVLVMVLFVMFIVVMIIMVIVVVMFFMMVVVIMVAASRCESSSISYSDHVDICDLLITIEPPGKR